MIQGLYTSLTGLNAYQSSVANSANNIANINTPGYKSNSITLSDVKNGGVQVSSVRRNGDVSYLMNTDNNLDLAIQSNGYFRTTDSNGNYEYTRNGNLSLDSKGDLVDSSGNVLLQNVGTDSSDVQVASDGTVTAGGQVKGQIQLYDKNGNAMPQNQVKIQSGALEVSDADMAKEIVNMNLAQYAFGANIAAVRTQNEMLGTILDLKG